ncbi:MAG: hypothetical protein B7X48_14700 [Acidiphilium sp. 34-60-192]|nr:MAG: hypothetical protein B7X48_14700 [Acidiphilium sp. 34-60-192]
MFDVWHNRASQPGHGHEQIAPVVLRTYRWLKPCHFDDPRESLRIKLLDARRFGGASKITLPPTMTVAWLGGGGGCVIVG